MSLLLWARCAGPDCHLLLLLLLQGVSWMLLEYDFCALFLLLLMDCFVFVDTMRKPLLLLFFKGNYM